MPEPCRIRRKQYSRICLDADEFCCIISIHDWSTADFKLFWKFRGEENDRTDPWTEPCVTPLLNLSVKSYLLVEFQYQEKMIETENLKFQNLIRGLWLWKNIPGSSQVSVKKFPTYSLNRWSWGRSSFILFFLFTFVCFYSYFSMGLCLC